MPIKIVGNSNSKDPVQISLLSWERSDLSLHCLNLPTFCILLENYGIISCCRQDDIMVDLAQ